MKDETINAKDALKAGGKVLRLQGGKSVVKIGGATLRSTGQYLSSFQVSTDDFTGSVPGKVKEAATNTGNILKKITNVVLHPLRNLIAMGKVILMGAVILLFLIIVSLLGQMSGTTSTSVFGANRIEDIQTLVQKINDYRNAAVTEGIYQAFQNDVDPNGNPYGYDSLTGQRSNNLQHIGYVTVDREAVVIFNDEGKLIPLPPNRLYGETDFFAGAFLICGDGGEDLISLTDSQITKYEKKYHSPLIFMELYPKPITLKCTPELYAKCMGEEHQHDTQENERDER